MLDLFYIAMKNIFLYAIIILLLILSSCTTSKIDNEINTSKYSVELKLIKELLNDPSRLIDKNVKYGCFDKFYSTKKDFWVTFIREHYTDNICDIENIWTIEHTFYNYQTKTKYASDILNVHIELESEKWGITFVFYDQNNQWCLGKIKHYPSLALETE